MSTPATLPSYDANGSPVEMVECERCRETVEMDATRFMEKGEALEPGYYCGECETRERRDRRREMGD